MKYVPIFHSSGAASYSKSVPDRFFLPCIPSYTPTLESETNNYKGVAP